MQIKAPRSEQRGQATKRNATKRAPHSIQTTVRVENHRSGGRLRLFFLILCWAGVIALSPSWPAGAGNDLTPGRHMVAIRPGEIRILPDTEYYPSLLHHLARAEHEIFLAMYLFKITDSARNLPANILTELIKAGKRGVKVSVLLEESDYNGPLTKENRRAAEILRKNNIRVFFDSPKVTTHAKLVVIDKRYVFLGSHNLTHSALARNHEFSILVDSQTLAQNALFYLKGLSAH